MRRTLAEVNQRLDVLYGRQWALEEANSRGLVEEHDEHDRWVEVYGKVTDEIIDLEQEQNDLIEQGRTLVGWDKQASDDFWRRIGV